MTAKGAVNKLPFELRRQLAMHLVENSFDFDQVTDWLNQQPGAEDITPSQVRSYSDKLRKAILKPMQCKDAGLMVILRQQNWV